MSTTGRVGVELTPIWPASHPRQSRQSATSSHERSATVVFASPQQAQLTPARRPSDRQPVGQLGGARDAVGSVVVAQLALGADDPLGERGLGNEEGAGDLAGVDPEEPQGECDLGVGGEAVEVEAWGRPTFRAGKKIFGVFSGTEERPWGLIFKPDSDERASLLEDGRFYSPPYFGPSGWLAVDLEAGPVDWDEVREFADASYRQVALRRMLTALDA